LAVNDPETAALPVAVLESVVTIFVVKAVAI